VFELEPVAAAHHYGLRIRSPELVLIGDFGGGTSDFSVLRLEPRDGPARATVLATAGVGIALDAFDAKLVRERVAPALGRGSPIPSATCCRCRAGSTRISNAGITCRS
jgi:hypothetical chaperone protein